LSDAPGPACVAWIQFPTFRNRSRSGAKFACSGSQAPPSARASGPVLPAMGYSPAQLAALARSIDDMPADIVVSGTPVDLAALVQLNKPVVRARYEFAEVDPPGLGAAVDAFLERTGLAIPPR
jgi:hypothetical protein